MIKVIFIRHSKTKGNLMHRYIGRTDESLCAEGIEILKSKLYPNVEAVYCSPMLRCVETADFIYPKTEKKKIIDFKECDFGDFENKNYIELQENKDYQKWIDSNGTLPFPNGEDSKEFKKRCIKAFDNVILDAVKNKYRNIALVVHGGTIMAILDKYSSPHKDYYNWQIGNAEMIIGCIDINGWIKNARKVKISF